MSTLRAGGLPSKLGRYELITRIGEGGMAEVQLAIQHGPAGFEKLVVVKLVHENLASQKTFVDMLLDEARVAALVKHPNVVDIYDLGEADGRYFIAMEYLEGEPLLAVLRAGREGQRLDVYSTARLIADTAEGLEAAHELRSMAGDPLELVHHDVSLGNIVVLYNGAVKLVDFGVAKATQSVATRSKVQGKFSYMAPEKLRGAPGDRRSDIFSLGCVLWEALTLKRLFKGGNDSETMRQVLEAEIVPPSQVSSEVPASLDPIVMRALERDADRRYGNAQQMSDDLETVLGDARYGRKNDLIARYMQETFKSHIDARKKLLQEVSIKGRASTAILEAAFDDPLAGAPVGTSGGEFSIRFRRPTMDLPIVPGPAPEPPPLPAPVVVVPPRARLPRPLSEPAAIYDRPPLDDAQPARPPTSPLPAPSPARARRTIYLAIMIAVVLAWIAIAIVVVLGRSDAEEPKLAAIAKPALARPALVARDAAPAIDTQGAEALFKAGLQAYLRGDDQTALAELTAARAANPGFPPTWRGLGLVYERLGDVAQARAALQRYLALAPTASDAPAIRGKLEALGP